MYSVVATETFEKDLKKLEKQREAEISPRYQKIDTQ